MEVLRLEKLAWQTLQLCFAKNVFRNTPSVAVLWKYYLLCEVNWTKCICGITWLFTVDL